MGAFHITLYKTSSDPRCVDKILYAPINLEVQLKSTCSVLNPVFMVSRENQGYFNGYNYLYCQELNRYYYMDLNIEMGGLMSLICKIDVLMSYRQGIRNLTCLVERQESYYNPYIADSGITISQGSVIKAIDVGAVGDASPSIYITCIGAAPEEE